MLASARAGAVVLASARAGAVVLASARAAVLALRTCCLPVTTSTLGRDPVLEIGSSHSSSCLAIFFFFFLIPPVAFPATPKDAVA